MKSQLIGTSRRQSHMWWLLIALFSLAPADIALAQQTTTQVKSGQATVVTEVRRGEVVYVSGNELVVKMEDGSVKHFTVPDDFRFDVEGKQLSVRELTPGMKLTQRVTTTSTPKTVTTVRTISGTVWQVNPPKMVILTGPDGKNKQYTVPDGTKFKIDGEDKTVFDLRQGMKVSATVVTATPETEVTRRATVTGQAPAPPAELPPAQDTAVLIEEAPAAAPPVAPAPTEQPRAAEPAPTEPTRTAEPAPEKLPKTASVLPVIGLLGAVAVLAAIGLRARRRLFGR